ncbi:MAG TPA: hypothetical protein VHN14_31440 [Kofleriaceae bacterium]|nr:hypothetical protein [Kofleriaceae bacterium]
MDSSELSVGISVQAAGFDNTYAVGSYQGIKPSFGWMRGRFGAAATVGLYHLTENGRAVYGLGDVMAAGHATVVVSETLDAGAALHVMVPTGGETDVFGMGHVMAMPSLWGTWRAHAFTIMASGGYGRAVTSQSGAHQDHGTLPLVDPMNLQELTWSAGADLEIGHGVRVGGRTLGGIPIGMGHTRASGGGRVAWATSRVSTTFELQCGVVGDPFTMRGVVETSLRF